VLDLVVRQVGLRLCMYFVVIPLIGLICGALGGAFFKQEQYHKIVKSSVEGQSKKQLIPLLPIVFLVFTLMALFIGSRSSKEDRFAVKLPNPDNISNNLPATKETTKNEVPEGNRYDSGTQVKTPEIKMNGKEAGDQVAVTSPSSLPSSNEVNPNVKDATGSGAISGKDEVPQAASSNIYPPKQENSETRPATTQVIEGLKSKDPNLQDETSSYTASTDKSPVPENTMAGAVSSSPSLLSSQGIKISYESDATPYVIGMIDYARDEAKLGSSRNKLDGLPKPQRGDKARARKLNDEALALMRQSKDAEAIPILEDAHRTDPLDVEIVNNLASAYFNTSLTNNDFSKAKAKLVDTLRLKPDRNIAWANLGHAFAMEGNEFAATNCYINFYRFSQDKDKALQSLTKNTNDPNPVLSKASTNAYQYVSTSMPVR
jgi:Flp pilus assembly protein TadD